MKIPQNAVDVAGYAIGTDYRSSLTFPREVAEVALSAALPRIRRAVIEELVEKYEAELRDTASLHYIERGSYLAAVVRKLRAELEGGDRG